MNFEVFDDKDKAQARYEELVRKGAREIITENPRGNTYTIKWRE